MSKKEESKIAIFRRIYLSEGDKLDEMLCGVIMVLVMIGYLRFVTMLEVGFVFQKTMILIPLGCIAAWGLIDGILYVLANLIERSKLYKLLLSIQSAKDPKDSRFLTESVLHSTIIGSLPDESKKKIVDEILQRMNSIPVPKPQWITKKDLIVVLYTFFIVFVTGAPLVIPFIIFNDLLLAIRVSFLIGTIMLFCIGYFWGKYASRHRIRSGIGLLILGLIIFAFTVVLGG